MTRLWLLKTEPDDYSYDDLDSDRGTVWDGVGNNAALVHMRKVRAGDRALIYHTGGERRIAGIARVTSDPYADPQRDDPKRVVFDVAPESRLGRPVGLSEIKSDGRFADWDLVRNSRLSVMPVPEEHWRRVMEMAGGS